MDIDALRKREIPYWALVNGQGVSVGGTSTLSVLFRRGMESICKVDANGISADSSNIDQLQKRGIQYFCEVTENGIDPVSSATLSQLMFRGIPPKCPVDVNGIAQGGSAKIETLRKCGIAYFCPLDENGTATTTGGGGGGPTAPVLAFLSESAGSASFSIDVDDTVGTGDSIRLQIQATGGDWSSFVSDTNHTITSPEDTANEIDLSIALPNGTYDARALAHHNSDSAWSNTVTFTISGANISTFYILGF